MTAEELIKKIENELAWPRSVAFALSSYDASLILSNISKTIREYQEKNDNN